jgi:hypothetical protein
MNLFNTYPNIGGMPEIIGIYAKEKILALLHPVFDGLITNYLENVEKCARNQTLNNNIRHTIQHAFRVAGSQITFHGFGNSWIKPDK